MTPELWQQVKKVLAEALALQGEERRLHVERLCDGDAELREEVDSLLAAHDSTDARRLDTPAMNLDSFAAAAAAAPAREGRATGPYHLVEKIGQGGMGEVYSAIRADGQYEKKVAIKLVRGGFSNEFILQRFRQERQILASLDHANVARLIDGGTTADGLPYLVMELVEGTPIDEYCDAHKLDISQRLELFLKVLAAVDYAHQRLVIHRDIKPSNILVAEDGTPKLLDFGIAKILDPAHMEATVLQPMTPEYASPEQMRGGTITTATDVYSLGVVLYKLLTGHSPFHFRTSAAAISDAAKLRAGPEPPSTAVQQHESVMRDGELCELTPESVSSTREQTPLRLKQRLKGDLDFILLKALRSEPEQRYSSVQRFADDIQRHLIGLPITARKGTWSYRAGRFLSRHRVEVAAAAVVFATLLGGIAMTVRAARKAEASRRMAEARFDDVRKLAHSLIFEVHDSIRELPGATAARRLIVQRAQEYLEVLSKDSQSDPNLLRELAGAYSRLASVQGSMIDANLGDSAGALKNRQKAVQLLTTCAALDPSNPDITRELAAAHRALSRALYTTGDRKGQEAAIMKAIELMTPLADAYPVNEKVQSEMADEYATLGNFFADRNDFNKSLENYSKALAIEENLASKAPQNPQYQEDVAFTHKHIAAVLGTQKQYQPALVHYRAALEIEEKLLSLEPQSARRRYNISYTYSDYGWLLGQMGEVDTALASYGKALRIRLDLAASDPNDTRAKEGLARTYNYIAWLHGIKGEYEVAIQRRKESLAIREALSQKDPGNEQLSMKVAQSYNDIGTTYADWADRRKSHPREQSELCKEANVWMEKVLPLYEKFKSENKLSGLDVSKPEHLAQQIQKCNDIIQGSSARSAASHAASTLPR